MGGFASNALKGAIGAISDSSLRDKALGEVEFLADKLERTEKELARCEIKVEMLEAELAVLKAKIPPDNMIDAGRFWVKKLADGSIDTVPYCYLCKNPMNVHTKYFQGELAHSHFQCANDSCKFMLPWGEDVLRLLRSHGVQADWPSRPATDF